MSKIRTTPRSQEAILARIDEAMTRDSFLATEAMDLMAALDREHLEQCPHVNQEALANDPGAGLSPTTPEQAHQEAVAYMSFALGKAHNQRGISAFRSLCHYAAWLWLCLEDEDYAHFEGWEDYTDYGLPQLAMARDLLGMEDPE